MGRKASNKIKVQLQVPELTYQRVAVKAMEKNLTVTDYLGAHLEGHFGTPILLPFGPPILPLLTPEAAPAKTEATEETKSAPPKKR